MAIASRRNRRPRVCPECPTPTPPVGPLVVSSVSGSNGDNFMFVNVASGVLGVVNLVEWPDAPVVINAGIPLGVDDVRKDSVDVLVIDLSLPLIPGALSVEFFPATYGIVGSGGEFIEPGTYDTVV